MKASINCAEDKRYPTCQRLRQATPMPRQRSAAHLRSVNDQALEVAAKALWTLSRALA